VATISSLDVAHSLRPVIARLARRMRQSASDLSPTQGAALATIDCHGPLTPSELAKRERIQRPTATRVLARLDELGLVLRAADPADRRSSLVSVSPAGAALLAELRTRKDAFLSERLEALGPGDRATLERAADLLEDLLA
jgi:DNA-binding MarR family transcriptional regulator